LKKGIRVLFEDDYYVVFDKPAGIVVIPIPRNDEKTLVDIVNRQYASRLNSIKLHPCHRIDRDTSGAIIFSKGKHAQKIMMDKFRQQEVRKTYIAFVHGRINNKAGEIKSSVQNIERQRFQQRMPQRPAVTRYKLIAHKKMFSIVEAYPITGRTNQIRIHFKQIGHPLVGERKYAFARDYSLKFRRAALHAHMLQWVHPVTGKKVKVASGLADDMQRFLAMHS